MGTERPGTDTAALLTEFADAAARLLDAPSQAREVLVEALTAAADVLGGVSVYRELRSDGPEPVAVFRRAHAALGDAVRQAGAPPEAVPVEGAPEAPVPEPVPESVSEPVPELVPELEEVPVPESVPELEEEPVPDASAVLADELRALVDRLRRETRQQPYDSSVPLSADPVDPVDPGAPWEALHLALLRVSPDSEEYQQVRRRLAELLNRWQPDEEEGTGEDVSTGSGGVPLRIVPPLPGFHQGIELSHSGTSAVAGDSEQVAAWAVRVEQAIELAEIDPELWWVERGTTYRSANRLPESDTRHRYQEYGTELLGDLRRYADAGVPDDDRLRKAQQLDGWFGGLLHKAPAEEGSWWWNWRREAADVALAAYVGLYGYRPVRVEDLHDSAVENVTEDACNGELGHGPLVQWILTTPLVGDGGRKNAPVVYKGRLVERQQDA
jgi:hypothetical protein